MEPDREIRRAQRLFNAKRVYAEPVERDGVTIVPAAQITGGAGGGGGIDQSGNDGGGFGFGVIARPVGAWVIGGGEAKWKPAGALGAGGAIPLLSALGVLLALILWISRERS
jgi:uncharacterized spore protein YtfJ